MKKIRQSEVAELAGVSLTTVSRVLNQSGYVAEDVRARVEKAVAELGYIPTTHSFSQRKQVIGLILPHALLNPYFQKLELCLHQACKRMGFDAVFAKADQITNETLVPLVKKLAALQVCGIVVASFTNNHLEPASRNALISCGVPVVFIERTADCYGFNRVVVDNKLGTFLATTHLIESGHTHLLYISKITKSETEEARLSGFLDAISKAGGCVHGIVRNCLDYTPKAAYDATQQAFQEDAAITGIVTWNDIYALGALLYVNNQGKHTLKDVEIIGYDDVLAPTLEPPISSVRMPFEEIANSAVEIIEKNCGSSSAPAVRTVLLEPQLILR